LSDYDFLTVDKNIFKPKRTQSLASHRCCKTDKLKLVVIIL